MSQRRALLKALTVLSKNFDKELDDDGLAIYELVLKSLTVGQIALMTSSALRSQREFMPRPGQLLNMAMRGEKTLEDEGSSEWSKLDRALRYDETRGLRPRTRRVALSFGSFSQLNSMPQRDFDFMRQWFISRYAEDCRETDGNEGQVSLEKQKETAGVPFIRPTLKLSV